MWAGPGWAGQALGHAGLDACRAGDMSTLRRAVEEEGWDPASESACDRHGSSALLWAAGGGHLTLCRYLVCVDQHDTEHATEHTCRPADA